MEKDISIICNKTVDPSIRHKDLCELNLDTDFIEDTPIQSPIRDYYYGKTVFLTGATGFLGQLFVQKLFSVGINKLYILARPKKGKSPKTRLEQLYQGQLFNKLLVNRPKFLDDIILVEGDLKAEGLGISATAMQDIISNVQIIIHSAAEVKFDEPLFEMLKVNACATRQLLEMAEKMEKLDIFCYVSTAYSHCHRGHIGERYYEPAVDPEVLVRLMKISDDYQSRIIEIITDKIISPSMNTYVYTKTMSEHVVKEFAQRVPVVIVRPSVVIATAQDPVAGWINNVYGLTGVLSSVGLGFHRILPFEETFKLDIICADYVINSALTIMWSLVDDNAKGLKPIKQELPEVFNITCDTKNSVDYKTIVASMLEHYGTNPSAAGIWIPCVNNSPRPIIVRYCLIFYHVIPGLIFDLIFKLMGNKIRLLPLYRKSQYFMAAITYFMTTPFTFDNAKTFGVYDRMSPDDRRLFPADVREWRWSNYSYEYYLGMRRNIARESLQYNPKAYTKRRWTMAAHAVVLTVYYSFLGFFWYLVARKIGIVQFISNCLNQLTNYNS